ncbi:MAG: cupin domain-containing protein [Planctomycetes bacterium]|nr:cupin domain-containing protein [Planctomycetota bacterium]
MPTSAARAVTIAPLLLAACTTVPPEGQVRIERGIPEQAYALAPAAIARSTLHDDPHATIQLVRLSGPIAQHRHLHSEEIVYLVSGSGVLHLRDGDVELRAGDLAVIPRNTPHGFTPGGAEPAVVLSTFVPHFIDGDRVMEKE